MLEIDKVSDSGALKAQDLKGKFSKAVNFQIVI